MKCPDCGIELGTLPCWRCERESWDKEWEIKSLLRDFSLVRGAPETDAARSSLDFALARIQKRVDEDNFHMTVPYNPQNLLRSETWWYVPYCWVGCSGFIVNLDDGYVNWLGSALSLRHCFWGQSHGIVCDLVDFTFAPGTTRELAARLLRGFKRSHPNPGGLSPGEPVAYRESEIAAAVANQFPEFKRHFAWFAIPDLFQAYEKERLRFTCVISPKADFAG